MKYLKDRFWAEDLKRIDGYALWTALQPFISRGELVVNKGKGEREDLVLVTYSKTYQYEHNAIPWDPLVLHCRGIIFDVTDDYRIVALPFKKFFNWGEGGIHYPTEGSTVSYWAEKVDGSLGICFYWRNKWHITTRGSLNSDIGEVAQGMLDSVISDTQFTEEDQKFTYLLEIVYPENRICVDYGDVKELVFLGACETSSGLCIYGVEHFFHNPPLQLVNKFRCTELYSFPNDVEMLAYLNSRPGEEFEGFVAHYSDGSIFKWKSEDYKRLHRIIAQFTFKRVLEAVQEGNEEEIRKILPEELIPDFDRFKWMIEDKVDQIITHVDKVVEKAPKDSRKEFALYLQAYYKGSIAIKYAFKFLDLNMNVDKLGEHILKSLHKDDFDLKEKDSE